MFDTSSSKIPDAYHFVDASTIDVEQILDLRKSVGWQPDTQERWRLCIEKSLAVVGIADVDGILVAMGCLAGNIRHAILCDLAVHPDHQRKGLGMSMLVERMRLVDELDITYLYTELAHTNSLYSLYLDLGFEKTGNGLFLDRRA